MRAIRDALRRLLRDWRFTAIAGDVALLVGAGTSAGLGLTRLAAQAFRTAPVSTPGIELYRPTADPLALLGVAAFMAAIGMAAACVPARRAATMDPPAAMRSD